MQSLSCTEDEMWDQGKRIIRTNPRKLHKEVGLMKTDDDDDKYN